MKPVRSYPVNPLQVAGQTLSSNTMGLRGHLLHSGWLTADIKQKPIMLVKQREDCKRWLPFKHTHSHFIFLRSDLQHQRSIVLIIITLCRVCGREKCFNITHGRLFSLLPSHAPYVSFVCYQLLSVFPICMQTSRLSLLLPHSVSMPIHSPLLLSAVSFLSSLDTFLHPSCLLVRHYFHFQ